MRPDIDYSIAALATCCEHLSTTIAVVAYKTAMIHLPNSNNSSPVTTTQARSISVNKLPRYAD